MIVLAEGRADGAGETALLSGVRSALCAPIISRGKPAGCFYVDHRHVSNLFGEDEQRLAEFIATIAGARLGEARCRVRDVGTERVAERTPRPPRCWRARELAQSEHRSRTGGHRAASLRVKRRVAKEVAEKANLAKGEFLANMSHEIRARR